jgi:hypothetical protein
VRIGDAALNTATWQIDAVVLPIETSEAVVKL